MRPTKDYESLHPDEKSLLQHEDHHSPPMSTTTAIRRTILKNTPWFLIAILSLSLVSLLTQHRLWTPTPQPTFPLPPLGLDCGTTATEAQSKNCHYDLLAASWIPAPCFDNETISEYRPWILSPNRSHGPFPYYRDNGTHNPGKKFENEREMSLWGGRMWTTQEEHVGHCIYMSRRLHRMVLRGGRVAGRTESFAHTRHCSVMALEAVENGNRNRDLLAVEFGMTFGSC